MGPQFKVEISDGPLTTMGGKRVRRVQQTSTYLQDSRTVNPFYPKVDAMEDSIPEGMLEEMMEDIPAESEFDIEEYLKMMEEKWGDKIDAILDSFENAEDPPKEMPVAPPARTLYNRVMGGNAVDIGSGNCNRLSKYKGKVTATDKSPQENPHMLVRELDAEDEALRLLVEKKDAVVTSFNALTQLGDTEVVESLDGLHVFPDVDFAIENGAVMKGNKIEYAGHTDFTTGPRGDHLSEGYSTLTTYASRKLELEAYARCELPPFDVPVRDINYRPYGGTGTPKHDGEARLLQINREGAAIMRARNGKGAKFKCKMKQAAYRDAPPPEMTLMLEKLPKVGKPELFVLFRVAKFNNFVPFHGINSLENFCKSIKITIDGAPVLPPTTSGHPTDGMIYRVGDLDYRYKDIPTFETRDIGKVLTSLSDDYALKVEWVGRRPEPGKLAEISVVRFKDHHQFAFEGYRTDKDKDTAFERVLASLTCI